MGGRVPHRLRRSDVEVVDLRDYPLPFFDGPPPAMTQRDYPSDDVARPGRKLDEADGFVVLTAGYNHGYPAVLKNAMDYTFVEGRRKPIALSAGATWAGLARSSSYGRWRSSSRWRPALRRAHSPRRYPRSQSGGRPV